jgi:hypothetical protein
MMMKDGPDGADGVSWYNTSRLMHHLGRIPAVEAEAEANYNAPTTGGRSAAHQ